MIVSPKVSIVIPVYNGSNFLRRAIDSALAQTYPDVEVLVVNDGSRDGGATREIALSYGDRIRYLEKENGGVSTALNMGIENMRGEYFSWLSHDDEYHSHKVQKQIEFLAANGCMKCLIFSDYEMINQDSKVENVIRFYNKNFHPLDAVAFGLINGCTMLIPKECFDVVGKFDAELPTTQDYDMWFRLIQKYPIRHLPEVLVRSRQHEEQQSHTDVRHLNECNRFYVQFADYLANYAQTNAEINEEYFIKLAAYLHKARYLMSMSYVWDQYIEPSWTNRLKWLYYFYVNTNWGNRVGLGTFLTDRGRLIDKLMKKCKIPIAKN